MVVLDTCAVLTLGNGLPMRDAAQRAVRHARQLAQAFVPSVAAGEIAQKAAAGRLQLGTDPAIPSPRAWIEALFRRGGFVEQTVSITAALHAYELPEPFHRDPADRLIVAMARLLSAPIVTVDRRILDYAAAGHVEAIAY